MSPREFPTKLRAKLVYFPHSVAPPRTNSRMTQDHVPPLNFLLLTFSYAKRLHPKNCLGVRQFAETMMCALLYDAANSFIHQHFVEVSMSEEFLALPLEDVLELVSRDELNVKSEEQVCRAESAGDMGGCCSFSSLEKVKQKTVQIVVCVPRCCLWVHFIIPSAHFMRTFFPHILVSK